MKLMTDIKARADGNVNAVTADGTSYDFKPDADGRLVAEVEDDAHVGFLLDSGNFYPADEDDADAGIAALENQNEQEQAPEEVTAGTAKKAGKKKSK